MIHINLGGIAGPDSDLFAEENLMAIKNHFQILQGGDNARPAVAQ